MYETSGDQCDWKRNRMWIRFPIEEMKFFFLLCSGVEANLIAALSSATPHAIPSEFSGKWRMEDLCKKSNLIYY